MFVLYCLVWALTVSVGLRFVGLAYYTGKTVNQQLGAQVLGFSIVLGCLNWTLNKNTFTGFETVAYWLWLTVAYVAAWGAYLTLKKNRTDRFVLQKEIEQLVPIYIGWCGLSGLIVWVLAFIANWLVG